MPIEKKISCISSYHLDYLTCGVARFNEKVSRLTNLPVFYFLDVPKGSFPLLSIKFNEFTKDDLDKLLNWCEKNKGNFDTYIHGMENNSLENKILSFARRNIACNSEISILMNKLELNNVHTSCCPCSNLAENHLQIKDGFNILSFGMAHKILEEKYDTLKNVFDKLQKDFHLSFSTAIHDGFELEKSFLSTEKFIKNKFNKRGIFLGMLSDDAIINYLLESDFFVTFFPNGYRENNSSINTAFENKICVITNVDHLSPKWLVHGHTFLDINKLEDFSFDPLEINKIAYNGHLVYKENINWEIVKKHIFT